MSSLKFPIGTLVEPNRQYQKSPSQSSFELITYPQYGVVVEHIDDRCHNVYLQEDMIFMKFTEYEIKEAEE